MYDKVIEIIGKKPGPTSIILIGVHGNEVCGVNAIKKLLPTLKIDAGKLYIGYGNPKAIQQNTRFVESNLNRMFKSASNYSKIEKTTYEYKRAQFLKKYLNNSDILLDIHATSNPKSKRFIICENNADLIVKYLPFDLKVNGFDRFQPGGTDYYMNTIGKIGICIECGYTKDVNSDKIAEKAILNFLIANKNILGNIKSRRQNKIKIYKLYKSKTANFSTAKKFDDFEMIKSSQLLGIDGNKKIIANKNSVILFAENTHKIDEECFLLGKK